MFWRASRDFGWIYLTINHRSKTVPNIIQSYGGADPVKGSRRSASLCRDHGMLQWFMRSGFQEIPLVASRCPSHCQDLTDQVPEGASRSPARPDAVGREGNFPIQPLMVFGPSRSAPGPVAPPTTHLHAASRDWTRQFLHGTIFPGSFLVSQFVT